MKKLSWPEWVVVTLGGSGLSPVAPATVASAVTCVIFWFASVLLQWPWMLLIVPVLFISVWLSYRAIGAFDIKSDARFKKLRRPNPKREDPDAVVIDEFVGQWITLIAVPHTLIGFGAAFFVFRFFDILKPLGVKSIQDFPGGWGIVLDDVLAGMWGAILLTLIFRIAPHFL